jgi:hypothetical protein
MTVSALAHWEQILSSENIPALIKNIFPNSDLHSEDVMYKACTQLAPWLSAYIWVWSLLEFKEVD